MAIGIIGAILWYVMSSSISDLMDQNGVSEARELPLELASPSVDPLYSLTLIIFVVTIIATLIAVFSTLAKNPAGLKNAAIGIVAFLIIVGIGFALATGVETPMKDGEVLSASGSKWVGTGLYAFYVLAAVAVGLMFFSGIKKLIGK
ncbi:hypothetical protein D1816_13260 [Aquimarina sp. AD10]|uniref:Uncharacterized protein n=2 Tax=Flavobacteriaceae TaxID=49546 RepID=A0A162YUX2_9FLAO|nr:hypothetical protein D1816_13260 [Aquimarina sp. AD10]KZS39370.1 hypothetical protein AWE51_12570 [Aquimarina aggregata]RKN01531.1 hypothetical protein D7033_04715 [Aquimarina sp. AD10]